MKNDSKIAFSMKRRAVAAKMAIEKKGVTIYDLRLHERKKPPRVGANAITYRKNASRT
ncbi:hypothetical protein [Xylanibacter brevis]|uniref:hypothetical protein n=1 Tax=Xylanibacter brevis TaxID=83231 RepID=UPI0012DC6A3B|nr:hypothetical protein [Xylanibacter brevis]